MEEAAQILEIETFIPLLLQVSKTLIYSFCSMEKLEFVSVVLRAITASTILSTLQQIHTYNTRNASNYRTHYCGSDLKQFTILHQGPKVWNSLPRDLTLSPRYSSFKTSLEKFLLSRTLNSVNWPAL